MEVKFLSQGESGLVVELGNMIDSNVNSKVHELAKIIEREMKDSIQEVVPTYRSLMIHFNPLTASRHEVSSKIKSLLPQLENSEEVVTDHNIITIPTCYGGELGPDMDFVASHNKLSQQEVIEIHTSVAYRVYMIGFTPAFPYLGGMSPRIATPRLEKPRTKISAGSVGIAGAQTGFYTMESPGGWQLIGRTPIKAFNPEKENPFLFAAGDFLQFRAVSLKEYEQIEKAVLAGEYKADVQKKKAGDNS